MKSKACVTLSNQHLFYLDTSTTPEHEAIQFYLSKSEEVESFEIHSHTRILQIKSKLPLEQIAFEQFAMTRSLAIKKIYELDVEGMTCASCENMLISLIKSDFENQDEIQVTADYVRKRVKVILPLAVSASHIRRLITDASFLVLGLNGYKLDVPFYKPPNFLHRGGINLAWAGLVYGLSMVLPFSFFLSLTISLISAIVMYATSRDIYIQAWQAAKAKATNMNTLLALGTSASWLLGLFSLFFPVVFHASLLHAVIDGALILGIVNIGRWMRAKAEHKAQQYAKNVGDFYFQFLPLAATKIEQNKKITYLVENIQVNDILEVQPDAPLPADAVLLSENARLMNEPINGESLPCMVQKEAVVFAGSINCSQHPILIQATAAGRDSKLKKLIDSIDKNNDKKAASSLSPTIDKIARAFIPAVLGLALLTFLGWALFGPSLALAFNNGVSLIIVACPCALFLAPLSSAIAIYQMAKRGVYFKESAALEKFRPKHIFFDKTGTLTILTVDSTAISAPYEAWSPEVLLQYAASVETRAHPIGRAILIANKHPLFKVDDLSLLNKAVSGTVQLGDQKFTVYVGHYEALLKAELIQPNSNFALEIERLYDLGYSVSVVAVGKGDGAASIKGILPIRHQHRPEAKATIASLKARGIIVSIITGDHSAPAHAVAQALGIDNVYANQSAEDKARVIKTACQTGITIMVGDGMNDTEATNAADIGVSIAPDEPSTTTASVILNGNLNRLLDCIDISQKTVRNIRQNLIWAFIFNCLNFTLVVAGFHNPILAAAVMGCSTLFVLLNALRLNYQIKPDTSPKPSPKQCHVPISYSETSMQASMLPQQKLHNHLRASCQAAAQPSAPRSSGSPNLIPNI